MLMPDNHYFVYIVGEHQGADVQIGIADDLQAFMRHKQTNSTEAGPREQKLVYYEHYDQEEIALNREKQIRENSLDATNQLIGSMNPNWLDLSDTLQY